MAWVASSAPLFQSNRRPLLTLWALLPRSAPMVSQRPEPSQGNRVSTNIEPEFVAAKSSWSSGREYPHFAGDQIAQPTPWVIASPRSSRLPPIIGSMPACQTIHVSPNHCWPAFGGRSSLPSWLSSKRMGADDASTGAENVSQSQTDAQVTDKLKKSLPAGFSLSPKKEPAIAPELQAVVDAWPTLPTDVRKMIEGVVKATVESGAERA